MDVSESSAPSYAQAKFWVDEFRQCRIFTVRSNAVFLLWFTIFVSVCLCMYVLVKCAFWIAVWPIVWKELVLLTFCLLCFDCGAVALSASFFPFRVLDGRYRFLIIAFLSTLLNLKENRAAHWLSPIGRYAIKCRNLYIVVDVFR